MIDETTQDLAALHAFDLLSEPERSAFARRLEIEPELRRLVDHLREAAVAPALAAPAREPSARLRARILASIAGPARDEDKTPAKILRFPAWLGWSSLAAAAALAFVAAYLRVEQGRFAAHASLAAQETRLLEAELRATRNHLEAERLLAAAQNQRWKVADAETVRLRDELQATQKNALSRIAELETRNRLAELRIASLSALAGQPASARGVAVWDPVAQQGVLTVSQLPALASDRDYQLWLVDPQYPTPVDGGVFRVDPATGEARIVFKADKPVGDASAFAISLERKGGVPVAEGPMVLVGK